MRFEKLVAASEAVKQTRSRQRKVELLAACVAELASEEGAGPTSLLVGVAYLAGELPQGRIGLGPSAVFKNPPTSAREQGELSVLDVDGTFTAIARVSGAGAVRERMRLWLG